MMEVICGILPDVVGGMIVPICDEILSWYHHQILYPYQFIKYDLDERLGWNYATIGYENF